MNVKTAEILLQDLNEGSVINAKNTELVSVLEFIIKIKLNRLRNVLRIIHTDLIMMLTQQPLQVLHTVSIWDVSARRISGRTEECIFIEDNLISKRSK